MSAPVRITLGVIFLILGVIGSLLPILQGWIFFVLALLMFFPEHPKATQFVQKIDRKYPKIAMWLTRMGVGGKHPQTSAEAPNATAAQAIMTADDDRTTGTGRRD